MREIIFNITDENDGRKIRDFLHEFGVSAALMKKLKKTENGIMLNGVHARAIDCIKAKDTLKITIESSGKMPAPLRCEAVKAVYDDEDLLVLNKPLGMPVHESRNHIGDTLSNAAAYYMGQDTAFRAVYRLDRDTSGLVLIAKNELAAAKSAGKVKKDYYAVCRGILSGEGTLDLPIRRVGDSIIKRGVFPDGVDAVTHWKAIKTGNNRTLLKINLETGRTHQIRVHFAHIGHPLLGDTLYGEQCPEIGRQALHCKTIYFTHPVTGEAITADSELPEDIKGLI